VREKMIPAYWRVALVALFYYLHSVNSKRVPPYGWFEYKPVVSEEVLGANASVPKLPGVLASSLVNQPVYVSITTIASRLSDIHLTISEILMGPVIPDRVYLFVSKSPYLIDIGIRANTITAELNVLAQLYPLSIIFVENIGPHRKLLPLLDKKWKEDCVIVTMDDEMRFWIGNYLQQLIKYYIVSGRESIVTLKARRIGFCDTLPHKLLPYLSWGEAAYGMHEFFLLPTGTGGILYRPKFFHPIVFDRNFLNLTRTTDDIAFRLATMVKGVFVVTGCRMLKSTTSSDYFKHVGSKLRRGLCSSDAVVSPSRLTPMQTTLSPRDYQVSKKVTSTTSTTTTTTTIKASAGGGAVGSQKAAAVSKLSLQVPLRPADGSINNNRAAAKQWARKLQAMAGGHRDKNKNSLYSHFNMREGNDNAIVNALQFLAGLDLLDMTVYASNYLSAERPNCFANHQYLQAFPGGEQSCMIQYCRRGNNVKSIFSFKG
jgi:hypothetical protein